MPNAGWKEFERRMSKVFGTFRRGPDTTAMDGSGKTDAPHVHYGLEFKLLGRPGYADLLAAAKQSEANSHEDQEPLAIVKRKNLRDEDALVVQRLATFQKWRL